MSSKLHLIDTAAFLVIYGSQSSKYGALLKVLLKAVFFYVLHNAYPNPFNPLTTINYDLPKDSFVRIGIYDLMGRQIKTLVNENMVAGYKSINWNATNDLSQPVSAGLYIYTFQTGEFMKTKKMVLIK